MPRHNTPIPDPPPPASARDVRALRDRLGVSQSGLASILNVSIELVQAWEGERRIPRGPALRLIELVRSRPELLATSHLTAAPAARVPRAKQFTDGGRSNGRKKSTSQSAAGQRPTRNGGRRAADHEGADVAAAAISPAPNRRTKTSSTSEDLLLGLAAHGVSFVTVGGVAAHLHGAPGLTDDLDIVYDRTPANLDRLATFLKGIATTLRGAPGRIPFAADPRTLAHTAVLALDTRLGPLDLRQRISGIGDFASTLANSTTVSLGGRPIQTLTLDALIVSKRATGRSRDREEVRALEALRQ